jgi:hypothetical protein
MNARHPRRGAVLILALGLLAVLGISAATLWAHLLRTHDLLRWESQREVAYHLAEGGLDYALARLRHEPDFREATAVPLGGGHFSVAVAAISGGYAIHSTGIVGEGPAAVRVSLAAQARTAEGGALAAWTQERLRP